jgi:hypothetical protein
VLLNLARTVICFSIIAMVGGRVLMDRLDNHHEAFANTHWPSSSGKGGKGGGSATSSWEASPGGATI